MPHTTETFLARNGHRLHARQWLPDDTPRAHIVIAHGIAEHGDRYAHTAAVFTQHGYAVHAFDQQGHGHSEGERLYTDSFDDYRDNLVTYLERVAQGAENRPIFLLGHSMGGAVVAYAAVTWPLAVAGIILSAPALKPGDAIPPLLVKAAKPLGRWFPHLPTTVAEPHAISRDPQVIARYLADPLIPSDPVPARTGAEWLRAIGVITERAEAFSHPLLIFHGTADRLTNVEGSLQLYALAGSADKTLKLYDGLYHECLNEPEQDDVRALILAWLDQRITE
jgi:alpha-beta hydrolase superfamily lysophospholipase